MGFRELAREFNQLATKHNDLVKEHGDTRIVLSKLVGSHNHFVGLTFWQRMRWLLRGK